MKSQYFLIALCCIVTTLLAGCGSSSHIANPSPSTPTNISGIFADAPVMGLSYSCGSTSDVTKAGGAFTCPTSSTVTFKIGGIIICSAPARAFMTPCELRSGQRKFLRRCFNAVRARSSSVHHIDRHSDRHSAGLIKHVNGHVG